MRYSIDQENSAWRVVDGEAVLINAETTFYYGLNPTATRIWKLLLDNDLTAEEIADGIASDSDKSSTGIAESIKCFLDELTVERLLTATEATASRPSDERLPGGLGDGDDTSGEWETPKVTRYDTLEELIVCGE